jgi:hypothetical protein
MIFKRPKRRMYSPVYLFGILIVGFAVYLYFRERIFGPLDISSEMEPFQGGVSSIPAPAPLMIRQAPVYPEQTISPSGPSAPSQQPSSDETIVYAPPQANDPYDHSQESSMIPENLRHPERAYRPSPPQHHTSIAVQSGLASEMASGSSDQMMNPEMINNGGEFMSGVFANDNFDATNFSSF